MTEKPRIIFLSPYLPACDTSGGARVIFDSIRLFCQAGYEVNLLSFCSSEDKKRAPEIGKYCSVIFLEHINDYSVYPRSRGLFRDRIVALCKANKKTVLQCEYAFMAFYLPPDIMIPKVLREHEVLSKVFHERAQLERNLIKKIIFYARAIKKSREERCWYSRFDRIVVFSGHDKDYVAGRSVIKRISSIPLGLNIFDYQVLPPPTERQTIIFIGNFSHSPNVDAALYFCNTILALIRDKVSDVRVLLVGAYPPPEITKLSRLKNVTVTGYVKDVRSYYEACALVVVPLRFGTGMRVKIIEALASGRPVVSTSVGARGIATDGTMIIADTAEDFALAVIHLLQDKESSRALIEKGRSAVEKRHRLEVLLTEYENMYQELVN